MAAKLFMANAYTLISARPVIEKTPTATIISTRVWPRRLGFDGLINIVLHAVLGDVGGESPGARELARRGPRQGHSDLSHLVAVVGRVVRKWSDGKCAVIRDAIGTCGRLRIVLGGECCRDKAVGVDLRPAV